MRRIVLDMKGGLLAEAVMLSMRELLSGRWKSGVSRRTSAT